MASGIVVKKYGTKSPGDGNVTEVIVGKKYGPALGNSWKRTRKRLYFDWWRGRLFAATSKQGPWIGVPAWALLAVQLLPQDFAQLQHDKPLWIEPGKQRRRMATEGERELLLIVALRSLKKKWWEIEAITGMTRRDLAARRLEIMQVVRDLDALAAGDIFDCLTSEAFIEGWGRHNGHGTTGRVRPQGNGPADFERHAMHGCARTESTHEGSRHAAEQPPVNEREAIAVRDVAYREAEAAQDEAVKEAVEASA